MPSNVAQEMEKLLRDPKFLAKFRDDYSAKMEKKYNNMNRVKTMFDKDQTKFDTLIHKIIDKNGDRWTEVCLQNGCEPYPSNLLYVLFDLSDLEGEDYKEPFDEFTKVFTTYTKKYMGYYFAITHGQGSVCSIYDSNKELIYRD